VDDDSTRASDDERERAALELREHLVAGRLTLEEFSERVELAYRAGTVSDLEAARSSLPVAAGGRRMLHPVRATVGFFAHIVRRGRLRLGRRSAVVSGFADVDLDLREAEIAGLVTDTGGTTSHPAVLSREFGIPAVIGTSIATKRIATGDRIRVDGSTGVVEVLETAAAGAAAAPEAAPIGS